MKVLTENKRETIIHIHIHTTLNRQTIIPWKRKVRLNFLMNSFLSISKAIMDKVQDQFCAGFKRKCGRMRQWWHQNKPLFILEYHSSSTHSSETHRKWFESVYSEPRKQRRCPITHVGYACWIMSETLAAYVKRKTYIWTCKTKYGNGCNPTSLPISLSCFLSSWLDYICQKLYPL